VNARRSPFEENMDFSSLQTGRSLRRAIRLAACVSAVAIVFACGGDKTPAGPTGTVFSLRTVAALPLPFKQLDTVNYSTGTQMIFVTWVNSGYIALQDNNTFESSLDLAVFVEKARGTYKIEGSTISLTSPDTIYPGQVTTKTRIGTYDGSTINLTLVENDRSFPMVFRK
jgi:hypothetical protein